ncbi:hypothetical protein J0915_00995 [Arthrobacter sp. zg-ZUI10]|nr:hypothetical protein [Arthrobacter sunyaminii]MBO0895123.1 hypothetical protein [Arthrobacter sunyaminii]
MARVFDAKGNTTGVLFLEDIIEELVGAGRHHRVASGITVPDGSFSRLRSRRLPIKGGAGGAV